MTTDEDSQHLWDWYIALKKGANDYRPLIASKIDSEIEPGLRRELFMLLGLECARLEDITGQIEVFEKAVKEFPMDPFMRTSLSGAYAYFSYDLPRALLVMNEAVEVARKTKQFRRQVLYSKAWLLRDMKDYQGLERCLLEIIVEPRSETADIAKEDDFLNNLPPGAISEEVLKAYAEFMAR